MATICSRISAACAHCSRVTSRCVTARTVRGPKSKISSPRSRARATTVGGVGRAGREVEHQNVGLRRREFDADTWGRRQPLGDQARVGVILGQSRTCRSSAYKPAAASTPAWRIAPPTCADSARHARWLRATRRAASRRCAESLGERHRNQVEGGGEFGERDARGHGDVPQARAVQEGRNFAACAAAHTPAASSWGKSPRRRGCGYSRSPPAWSEDRRRGHVACTPH